MHIDMVGHATVAIETRDRSILFDPVLGPSHQQGRCAVFPPRRVLEDRLPRFDTLVISHQHLDHFDIASLRRLPRDVDVFLPADPLLHAPLQALGFERCHLLRPYSHVKLGETHLFTLPSEAPLAELGFVVWDEDGCCWNAVDTMLTQDAVAIARSRIPQVDVLLATWQPLLEGLLMTGQAPAFPFAEYGRLLQRIYEIAPTHVVPASAGYRYLGDAAWQNRVAFPVTRERFAHDVGAGMPALRGRVHAMDPGDRLVVHGKQVRCEEHGCPWIEREPADPTQLDFAPVLLPAPLVDSSPAWARGVDLPAVAERILDQELPSLLRDRVDLLGTFARWELIWQITVVLPGCSLIRVYDFSDGSLQVGRERDPRANALVWTTGSGLHGLDTGHHDWSGLVFDGGYRSFNRLYRATASGLARPENAAVPNLLQLRFPVRAVFKAARQRELEEAAIVQGAAVSEMSQ